MADAQTSVSVTPTTSITLQAPPVNNSGSEAIAAALLKSSENQAAATISLIGALTPVKEAEPLSTQKPAATDSTNLLLLGLIVWLALK